MRKLLVPLVAALLSSTAWAAAPTAAPDFWSFWGDGKAELDGYALTIARYGERRAGKAVLIFVTEDFADDLRVKADAGKHPPSDVYPVMKLNAVRHFQTGIYDYTVMASTFVKTDPDLRGLVKLAFSATEWCGITYEELLARGGRLAGTSHSYFDGEGDQALDLALPPGGVVEEALPMLVRGLRGDLVAPGASKKLPFLPAAQRARLGHFQQAWGEATLARAPTTVVANTAIGKLPAWVYTVDASAPGMKSDKIVFYVEDAYPHRVLSWTSTDESAHILGSARLKYWELHGQGGEKYLQQLGLPASTGTGSPRSTAR